MVSTFRPFTCTANIRQARTDRPSTSTVQAPQTPCSQPTCVPVKPNSCRRKSARLMRASTVASTRRPLIVTAMACLSAMGALQGPVRQYSDEMLTVTGGVVAIAFARVLPRRLGHGGDGSLILEQTLG